MNRRVAANLVWVVLFAAVVTVGAFLTFVTGVLFDDSYQVRVPMPEAGGVLPDQEVTVLGRAVGQVADVEVTREGVVLTLEIDGGQQVPDPAVAQVLRRSPIGEQAVDLRPTTDDWAAAEPGATIEPVEAIVPAPVPFLLEQTVDLFAHLEPDEVGVIVHELSVALDGRSERLRMLNRDSLELQSTLVDGLPEFERLIDSSETVLGVLREQRDALRSALHSGADLTELFAAQRPNVEALLDAGTPALDRTSDFVLANRANLGCLMRDVTDLNEMLLGPSTYEGAGASPYASKLDELERALVTHRFFFQEGFDIIGQFAPDTGLGWVRVLLVADELQKAEFYGDFRPTPTTRPGAACLSDHFGPGVNAVRQDGVQAPHETAPDIDWAPEVAPADATGDERNRPEGDGGATAEGRDRSATSEDQDADAATASRAPGEGPDGDPDDGPVALDTTAPTTEPGDRLAATLAGVVGLLALPALAGVAWWLRRRDEGAD
ncbi:MlaD family protein [Egicoccus sp. AB-alg2]|uniref:MlaD family protein n=1 Tax=Egicoccus sp. AB-alg2 TaxID=3242693 RepID=UPI00359CEEF4